LFDDLPLLSVARAGDADANQCASSESASFIIVAAVVAYWTPPTFNSTILDDAIAYIHGHLRSRDDAGSKHVAQCKTD